ENDHHHHVFCTNCGEVEDITLSEVFEKQLSDEISNIHKTSKYLIKEHTLELIGLCSDCD
ncbi:transcriptional repressor, partial [Candidatus Actinomarina sp.]|nr:transcriptional repressor [Candidatus Actinomarina sp.]